MNNFELKDTVLKFTQQLMVILLGNLLVGLMNISLGGFILHLILHQIFNLVLHLVLHWIDLILYSFLCIVYQQFHLDFHFCSSVCSVLSVFCSIFSTDCFSSIFFWLTYVGNYFSCMYCWGRQSTFYRCQTKYKRL